MEWDFYKNKIILIQINEKENQAKFYLMGPLTSLYFTWIFFFFFRKNCVVWY